MRKLDAGRYLKASGALKCRAQAARENARIEPLLDLLSLHTPRTGYLAQLDGYIAACAEDAATLEAVLGGKKVPRRKMDGYIRRRSCLDGFLASLPVKPRETIVAYGAANWRHYGGICTPTTAVFKACKRHFRGCVLTDEFRTTATNFWTGEWCAVPYWRDEKGAPLELRGLKCSKSTDMVGLWERGTLGRMARECVERGSGDTIVAFSRDGNAALNIRECIARTARPHRLSRTSKQIRPAALHIHIESFRI
jgi:hypothetical protein